MCIIIIKDSNKVIDTNKLIASAVINPHGLGVLWLDDWKVTYHESNDYMLLKTDRPYIAHFRYATVGAISRDNCHPFNINKNEILFQNGTVYNLGSKEKTDTQHLAEILSDVRKSRWRDILEMTECRSVTANLKEQYYEVYNEQDWIEDDGILYSKKNILNKHLIAVYGTLKYGNSNYHNYLTNSRYVSPAYTLEKYPLIIDGLPYLLNKPGEGYNVEVDLFLIDDETLEMVDRLEGHPEWYYREPIDIFTEDGNVIQASIYFNDKEDTGIHHESYESHSSIYYEDECMCDCPEIMHDEYSGEDYCVSCMELISY